MKVIFRYDGMADEVLAVFPEEVYRCGRCLCYAHIGQHFEVDYTEVIRTTKPATEGQYMDLLAELESVGYKNLQICKKKVAKKFVY